MDIKKISEVISIIKKGKYKAFLVDAVDSNGSGDVFHGAFAFAVTNNMDYKKACVFSSAVSALKCTKVGAREGVPTYEETVEFCAASDFNGIVYAGLNGWICFGNTDRSATGSV